MLDARASSDPDPGDQLSYVWDLDGDGAFDDSTASNVTWTYQSPGSYNPAVRVTDREGETSTKSVRVEAGTPPVPTIDSPAPGAEFSANETFSFSGSATDAEDGAIGAAGLGWKAVLHHCTEGGGCHDHQLQGFTGVAGGELTLPAHERPYYLTLTLTARDSSGLEYSTSVDVYPKPERATGSLDRLAGCRILGRRSRRILRSGHRPRGRRPSRIGTELAIELCGRLDRLRAAGARSRRR